MTRSKNILMATVMIVTVVVSFAVAEYSSISDLPPEQIGWDNNFIGIINNDCRQI